MTEQQDPLPQLESPSMQQQSPQESSGIAQQQSPQESSGMPQQQSFTAPPQQAPYSPPSYPMPSQQVEPTTQTYNPYTYQQPQAHYAAYSPQPPMQQHVATHQASTNPPTPKKPSKVLPLIMGVLGVFIGALITAGILFIVTDGYSSGNQVAATGSDSTAVTSPTSITINPPAEDSTLAEAVAAKTLPSVVNIDVYTSASGGLYGDSGSSDGTDSLQEYGLGSGVVISTDGYILTNYHVVEGGTEYLVRFDQSTQYKATVVGQDPSSDLAVLKVDATGLTPIEIGDSSQVKVGEWVMALGSPFGLDKSVSSGIVSALFRSTTMESTTGVNFYANMIQTDAAINPGNSGGALVNSKGELIGINTLISSSSGASAGVGFAIPSNYAMNIAQQIMDGKVVEHAYLGVQLRSVDAGNASSLNSTVDTGAYIGVIMQGSPAEKAGLKVGDVITKLDDTPISSAAELVINIRGHLVGDKVTLEFERDGKTQTATVVLGSDSSNNG